jgi:Zn-dependent metalloprotease
VRGISGLRLDSTVRHDTDFDNAFWMGGRWCMAMAIACCLIASPSVSTCHELTHGVTQFTAGLSYRGQPCALNESMSDVFGSLNSRHTAFAARCVEILAGASMMLAV